MKEFIHNRLSDEDGAETVEVIIGIVVFVVFGLVVYGMITKAAGTKMADVSNCLKDSGTIISTATASGSKCTTTDTNTYKYGN
jgi:Flp pilus assembly pilin Flp